MRRRLTPQGHLLLHPAGRRSRGSSQQPSGYQPTRSSPLSKADLTTQVSCLMDSQGDPSENLKVKIRWRSTFCWSGSAG